MDCYAINVCQKHNESPRKRDLQKYVLEGLKASFSFHKLIPKNTQILISHCTSISP